MTGNFDYPNDFNCMRLSIKINFFIPDFCPWKHDLTTRLAKSYEKPMFCNTKDSYKWKHSLYFQFVYNQLNVT